jgi:Mg-chelatase subunit ChlD
MGSRLSASDTRAVIGVPVIEPTAIDVTDAPASTGPESSAPLPLKKLDLVFTIDTTGSMGQYIQAAKEGITGITSRLAETEGYDLRYGLIAYRDHPPQDLSYVTKTYEFTNSLTLMRRQLGELSANGGGDGPEAVAAALKATSDFAWREDATKVVVLIADAPPHGLGESGDGFPNGGPDGVDPLVVLDEMSAKGITIYSVGCQPALSHYRFATEFFIACAQRTNGQAVSLGDATALADVILGASIEEMDLEALTNEVGAMAQQFRTADPTLTDDDVQQRVYRGLQSRGVKTRQMGGARLASDFSHLVSAAPSLAEAKTSLCSSGPPAPASRGLFGHGAAGAMKKKPKGHDLSPDSPMSRACAFGSAAAPPPPAFSFGCPPPAPCAAALPAAAQVAMADVSEPVDVAEKDVSYEQVSRLWSKGKAKGSW